MMMVLLAVLAADPRPLGVGLVATTNDKAANAQAAALAGFVGQSLGRKADSKVFADYDALATAVAKGEVEVALMGPLAYVRAETQAKVTPLLRTVRKGQATYRAVLFSKARSPLATLNAMKKAKNLKVAWVDPSSATGYVLPKAMLVASGIDPAGLFVTQDFLNTHDAVCKAVSDGKYDVGATFSDDPVPAIPKATGCEGALGAGAGELTIIAATAAIPNDVLVVSATFPADQATKLSAAAKALSASAAGKKTLTAAFIAEGTTSVKPEDFAPVRGALETFKR